MKNKKLIIFMAFTVIAVSIFCSVVIKKTKQQTLTVTDVNGITYVAILDQNNEVYAGVTDESGNMYAAKMTDGIVHRDQPVYVISNYSGTYPYNDTTRTDDIQINQANDAEFDFSGDAVTKAPDYIADTTQSTSSVYIPVLPFPESTTVYVHSTEEQQDKYMSEKFIRLFNSGIFAMTFTTNDPDLPGDITFAMRNNSIYMDTTMEDMSCKIVYDSDASTGFVVVPDMKVYCTLPDSLAKEMAKCDFSLPEISSAESIEVYDVEIDGKDCVCEDFKYPDNKARSFYYYNGNLVRMIVYEGESSSLYNIKQITSDVDNSYFEVPKGYLKVNLSWLKFN